VPSLAGKYKTGLYIQTLQLIFGSISGEKRHPTIDVKSLRINELSV
jgi:hypothetical protein